MIEVMRIGIEDRLMKKRSTSIWTFNFVTAYVEIYQAVEETHAAVGPGAEKQTIAELKKYVVEYYSGTFQKEQYTL